SSDGQIQIAVSDDGKGFDFDSLSGADSGRSNKPFGLLEIRERLNWIGGDLQIKSQPGVGTKVSLTVPAELRRMKPRQPEIQPSRPPAAASPQTGGNGLRARILVADDHAMFREGLISLLSHEPSFEVVGEAADGQE